MKKNFNEILAWEKFRRGDESAFSEIYQNFVQPLYSYSMGICGDRELIKDCLHDLFVELWKNHANLGSTTSVKYYLMASIKRKLIRQMDTQLKSLNHYSNYCVENIENFQSQELIMIKSEDENSTNYLLNDSLKKLSKRQRQAISLKYYQNMDTDQISESMNINNQSVYNLIFGALRILKGNLSKEAVVF
jgi:RNA polymerase sigma factor (sigma-70 family)